GFSTPIIIRLAILAMLLSRTHHPACKRSPTEPALGSDPVTNSTVSSWKRTLQRPPSEAIMDRRCSISLATFLSVVVCVPQIIARAARGPQKAPMPTLRLKQLPWPNRHAFDRKQALSKVSLPTKVE